MREPGPLNEPQSARPVDCSSPSRLRLAESIPARRTGPGARLWRLVVNAAIGKTDYQVAADGDITVGSHVVDFLVTAADLGFTPDPGERVEADGVWYELKALRGDAPEVQRQA